MVIAPVLKKSKEDCCGCEVCTNICPTGAISMQPDEQGFYYPQSVKGKRCISCNQCIKSCPMEKKDSHFTVLQYLAGSLVSDTNVINSSSGGAAAAIAEAGVAADMVIYGVIYTDQYKNVQYYRTTDYNDLLLFRTSKYSQARKNDTYQKIKFDLNSGLKVIFFGLPCDIAALKNYIGHNDLNLYTIELICHGPTSPSVHSEYCDNLELVENSKISDFSTRYKKGGQWKPFYIHAEFENGKLHQELFHYSNYGVAFRYLKRPSCYKCKFKIPNLFADLTIGDYHYVEKGMNGWNPHGVSVLLPHNVKGNEIIALINKNNFTLVEISKRGALANGSLYRSIPEPKNRTQFIETYVSKGLNQACKLSFVRRSNLKRKFDELYLLIGIRLKRLVYPISNEKE